MIESDKARFTEILNDFGVIHGKKITTDLARVYWVALKNMPLHHLERATQELHRTGGWFPKPSDFIRAERAGWQ
jgi:hypothetical protein